jgi:hypothetical protein
MFNYIRFKTNILVAKQVWLVLKCLKLSDPFHRKKEKDACYLFHDIYFQLYNLAFWVTITFGWLTKNIKFNFFNKSIFFCDFSESIQIVVNNFS